MFTRILVAVDGSECSDRAVDSACKLANQLKAELHLAHTVDYQPYYMVVGAASAPLLSEDDFKQPGKTILEKSLARARQNDCENAVAHLLDGNPGRVLVEKADELKCDLIILGSRGHGDLASLLLGSVSHRVCQSAHCACLIIR